jgi:hypothetical protein
VQLEPSPLIGPGDNDGGFLKKGRLRLLLVEPKEAGSSQVFEPVFFNQYQWHYSPQPFPSPQSERLN